MTDKTTIDSIAAKIRALLAKTTENGCSEDEAIAAALKARELMDKYNLTLSETELRAEPVVKMTAAQAKTREHKSMVRDVLVMAVGRFCEVKPWRCDGDAFGTKAAAFLGIKGDAEFAAWLCEALVDFCLRGADSAKRIDREIDKRSFAYGAAKRIAERLSELTRQKQQNTWAGTGQAMVVATKHSLIQAWLADSGLSFGKYNTRRTNVDGASYGAGQSYGNGASFGRPVNGGAGVLRIGGK